MSERFKYALNGVYRCENFAQHLAADNFTPVFMDPADVNNGWLIVLKRTGLYIHPEMCAQFNQQRYAHFYFNVIKNDGSSIHHRATQVYLNSNENPRGPRMEIAQILESSYGYLDNGALVIEYGLQVISIMKEDKIWRFNLDNPVFECVEKKNMIKIHSSKHYTSVDFYVHKQLLTFHSSYFNRKLQTNVKCFWRDFENILQIAQGVQVKGLSVIELTRILKPAIRYQLKNVIHYCERQLIENDLKLYYLKSWVIHWNGLRHYLVHLLKNVKSLKGMIDVDDIGKMKGETMKIFVAKFFDDKY